ncbi:hypothetical protein [Ktedonobacter racemifer]|uniref:Uncharacterized protein n=1 Tax=Ktedonobacter racemifer DSM 44963 TaxID=485913 RepID=D6U5Q5_KTERA|nr:hypothetical protein [Ktedonobacter racemifer]EFH80316.1 hypothetical protein Krac_0906 [Ktedonobacter racemifer DSM 44963]
MTEAAASGQQPRIHTVQVYGKLRAQGKPAFERQVAAREVSFTCQRCGTQKTEMRYPGPLPRYCPSCREARRAEAYEVRVAKQREKRRKQREAERKGTHVHLRS